MNDLDLLRQFVRERSHDAFATLVRRHVDVVYTAAVRQARGDTDAAEEVTQRVFILLAQKASTLIDDPQVLLGGWLFNAVRFIARDVTRKEERRARHEQKAAQMADQIRGSSRHAGRYAAAQLRDPDVEQREIEEELDEALANLPDQTRGILVLKYFQGKTAREVGEQLGITEEAARKRVSRAVDELRQLFLRRGVVMSASALAEGMATIALIKAPEGLAAASASAASAASAVTATAAAASAAATSTAAITGGVLMASAKIKTAALVAAVLLLTGGAVTVGPKFFSPVSQRTVNLAQAGASISGTVVGPDGQPVTNAQIRVGAPARATSPYADPRASLGDAVTDASGRFEVAKPEGDRYVLAVTAPQGYAEVSWKQLARGTQIKLEPWGRIEGVAHAGGKPQPKVRVRLWRVGENDELVSHQTETTADANGRFVFARVAPGGVQIYRTLSPDSWLSTDWRYVEVPSGKTVEVNIGRSGGRSVVGRVAVPPELAHLIAWQESGPFRYEANVRMELPGVQLPGHQKDEAPEEYRAIEEAFGRTEAGRLHKEWRFGSNFLVNADGTFHIDNLPPGKYVVTIRHWELQEEVSFLEDVARTELKFEIPAAATAAAAAATAAAQPIDVGTAVPERLSRVRPGEVAPEISVKTIDGATWSLAGQKGKVVVLVCWGAYDRREQELEGFRDLARKWAKDPRVAILGIVAAPDDEDLGPWIKEFALDFPHTPDSSLMNKIDNSWPSAVVIGRDGKVVQKHLNGQLLLRYVQSVVDTDKPPASSTRPARRR